jgi:hypothetical protein
MIYRWDVSDFKTEVVDLFDSLCFTHVLFGEERLQYVEYLSNEESDREYSISPVMIYGSRYLVRFFASFNIVDHCTRKPTIDSSTGLIEMNWKPFFSFFEANRQRFV